MQGNQFLQMSGVMPLGEGLSTLEKTGRNEPCPCGSGKKYKKCCLEQDQAAAARRREASTTAPATLDWLAAKFPEQVRAAVEEGFYGGLKKAERAMLDSLGPHEQELLGVNVGEWLLTDAVLRTGEDLTPVKRLLQDPAGPPLPAGGRQWLSRLADRSLSLYEVCGVDSGAGMMLADLLQPGEPPFRVIDRVASQNLVKWQMIGARVVTQGEDNVLSGALYPFDREAALESVARIRRRTRGEEHGSGLFREKCTSVITTDWLRSLLRDDQAAEQSATGSETGCIFEQVTTAANWADVPLDGLSGKSPREAVKTAAGRRTVTEMLKRAELRGEEQVRKFGGERFPFQALWERLGLDPGDC